MNSPLQVCLKIFLPLVLWIGILYLGYGAQSLSQIIEIPIVLIGSLIIANFMESQKLYKVLAVLFLFVFLLRTFMPQIPE